MGVKTDAAGVRRLVGAYGRADGRSVASVSSIDWSDMSTVCVERRSRQPGLNHAELPSVGGRLKTRAKSSPARCPPTRNPLHAEHVQQ